MMIDTGQFVIGEETIVWLTIPTRPNDTIYRIVDVLKGKVVAEFVNVDRSAVEKFALRLKQQAT